MPVHGRVARHCRAVGCAGWAGQGIRQGGRGPHGAAGAGGARRKGDCPLSASPSFCLGVVHWRGAFAGDAWAAGVQEGCDLSGVSYLLLNKTAHFGISVGVTF